MSETPLTDAPIEDSYFGCFTGDCPHDYQTECFAAIREYCSDLERDKERLETQLSNHKTVVEVLNRIGNLNDAEYMRDIATEVLSTIKDE